MENEKEPLVDVTTTETVVEPKTEVAVEEPKTENVTKTYTQAEVDELLKGKFTQEQVDAFVEKRLIRERKEREKLEEAKAVEPVNNEQLNKVKSELVDAQVQLAKYEKETALANYEIKDEFKEYVDFKVTRATNKDKDYATALKEFMESEGQGFVRNASSVVMPRPQNTNQLSSDEDAIAKMKKAFGL